MQIKSVASIYAQALLEAAEAKGERDRVRDEVEALRSVLVQDPEVRVFVESPRLERAKKRAAFAAALAGRVSDVFLKFLSLVLDKGRAPVLVDIFDRYLSLYDERTGKIRARVISAVQLGDDVLEALRRVLSARFNKEVLFETRVNPEILGGLIVRFDGMVADGSLKSALDAMRSRALVLKFGSELVHEDQS